MQYWLMKSEPDAFSIDHLKRDKSSWWDGVRNYQARNFMMNDMRVGDQILFYHSSTNPPGIVGLAEVSRPAEPDLTAQNKNSKYYDPKASPEKPIWYCVQVKYRKKFKQMLSLNEIKAEKALSDMLLVQRGQRLSIQPVQKKHFDRIIKLIEKKSTDKKSQ